MDINIRPLLASDYPELLKVMQKAYPKMKEHVWEEKSIQKLTKIFPEGQICITVDDQLAAVCLSIIVRYEWKCALWN